MTRWYGDPVAVRSAAAGTENGTVAGEGAEGAPAMFLWRDRVYVVREVLGRWRERRAWWAGASEALDSGEMVLEGSASAGVAGAGPVVEQEVWRLEAGAGGLGRGVFDLGRDLTAAGPSSGWRLLRTLD